LVSHGVEGATEVIMRRGSGTNVKIS
jgi:hypothetical protein